MLATVRRGYSGKAASVDAPQFSSHGEGSSLIRCVANRLLARWNQAEYVSPQIARAKAPFAEPVKSSFRFQATPMANRRTQDGWRRNAQRNRLLPRVWATPIYGNSRGRRHPPPAGAREYGRLLKFKHESGVEHVRAPDPNWRVKSAKGYRAGTADR